jgi:hypothetical protein
VGQALKPVPHRVMRPFRLQERLLILQGLGMFAQPG